MKAADAFNVPVKLGRTLPVGQMPLFLRFSSQPVDQAAGTVGGVGVIDADITSDNGVSHGIDGVLPAAP